MAQDETTPLIVNSFGTTDGLNKPGFRYLKFDERSADHARPVTLDAMRQEAYRDYDERAANAWRRDATPDAPRQDGAPTQDAREAAYAAYDFEQASAWRGRK